MGRICYLSGRNAKPPSKLPPLTLVEEPNNARPVSSVFEHHHEINHGFRYLIDTRPIRSFTTETIDEIPHLGRHKVQSIVRRDLVKKSVNCEPKRGHDRKLDANRAAVAVVVRVECLSKHFYKGPVVSLFGFAFHRLLVSGKDFVASFKQLC